MYRNIRGKAYRIQRKTFKIGRPGLSSKRFENSKFGRSEPIRRRNAGGLTPCYGLFFLTYCVLKLKLVLA